MSIRIALLALAVASAPTESSAAPPPNDLQAFLGWCDSNWDSCRARLVERAEFRMDVEEIEDASCLPADQGEFAERLSRWMRDTSTDSNAQWWEVAEKGMVALWPCLA